MMIISNTLAAMTNKCKRGWRYGEGNCFFNTKCILSLFLAVNIFTVITFIKGKEETIKLAYIIDESFPYLLIVVPVTIFILLSLFYPRKKVLAKEMSPKQEMRSFLFFVGYAIISFVLLFVSAAAKS
jgi:hypothetical protein